MNVFVSACSSLPKMFSLSALPVYRLLLLNHQCFTDVAYRSCKTESLYLSLSPAENRLTFVYLYSANPPRTPTASITGTPDFDFCSWSL